MEETRISPSQGHVISGVIIDPHTFEGKVKAAQLFQFAIDPRRTEDEKVYRADPTLQGLRRIRLEVQRLFSGKKKENVEPYAKYILEMYEKDAGITPTIVLWTSGELIQEERRDGMAQLMIPFEEQLVAIDGETQLAARYEARDIDPSTAKAWVAIKICHGRTVNWARQAFHDLNVLGVHPAAALAISMDGRDPMTSIARRVEEAVTFFQGRINKAKRQLSKNDTDVMTITALRGACITLAEGIGGVRYGAKPITIDPSRLPQIERVAIEWFSAVVNRIGTAIEDRERTIASAPPVMAAIGAMGHTLAGIPSEELQSKATEYAERLTLIKWEKGKHWEGIAGKYTAKGNFAIGGSKETAYGIYSALTDTTSEGYRRIREGYSRAENY